MRKKLSKDLDTMLDALNPIGETAIGKGNSTAHKHTVAKAKSCTQNPTLAVIPELFSKGQPDNRGIKEAAIITRMHLIKSNLSLIEK